MWLARIAYLATSVMCNSHRGLIDKETTILNVTLQFTLKSQPTSNKISIHDFKNLLM
jgi:hypothetical protein